MPPRHVSHRRLRKLSRSPADGRGLPLVLLALAGFDLSERVAAALAKKGAETVQLIDEWALERYLFRADRALPDVVVWQVGLASLAALDAIWRAHRAGCGPRVVVVGDEVAAMRESRAACGVWPGSLVYSRPEAQDVLEKVGDLLRHASAWPPTVAAEGGAS